MSGGLGEKRSFFFCSVNFMEDVGFSTRFFLGQLGCF